MTIKRKDVAVWAAENRDDFVDLLRRFVEIPSISMEPNHRKDVARMAREAVATLKSFGFKAKAVKTAGHPLVCGASRFIRGAPTVTIYNHMDVQPGGDPSEWDTDPFTFTPAGDGTWYGRGTTDDKGPALTALFAARYVLQEGVPLNIRFLWECEEEIGSPSFDAAIRSIRNDITTDFVCVSDTIWVSRTKPAQPAGLRGLQGFELVLETGSVDQHSGVVGGAARNPIGELAKLLTDMHDATTGRVKIPGFYADVIRPAAKELANFGDCGFSLAKFRRDHGFTAKSLRTNDPLDVMKRVWVLPTFEIHGIVGGYTGPGIKTAVPPRAVAKVSMRLVPDQRPEKILKLVRDFVKARNPDVKVVPEGALAPYRGTTEGVLADIVRDAVEFGFKKRPVFVREGGSIGAVVTMEQVLKAPVVFLGLSLPEHGYHAPNENYDWGQASGGIAAFAHLFERAAAADADVLRGSFRRPRR